jgi:N-acetyl-alpha-D-glucosaminyl L-malate synthase BshA
MKIGVTCYPTMGGSGIVATELGLSLAKGGDEIHFISYAQPRRLTELTDRIFYHEVSVPSYPLLEYPPYSLALASRMAEVAEAVGLDVLHVHYALPHAVSAHLAREMLAGRRELPLVTTLHGTDITIVGADASYLPVTKFGIERSDVVTAVSRWLRDETRRKFGITRDIEVVPNFVDGDRFRPDRDCPTCDRLRALPGKVLVHISNFRPVKRVLDVATVFAAVRARGPARLLLVGDGPDRAACERQLERGGLLHDVEFLGAIAQIESILPAADLFLMPSLAESFGLAALEAMASGIPVAGYRAGGLPEVVGETGILAPPGDVRALAEESVRLLEDEPRRAELGRAARERALELYPERRIVESYRELYEGAGRIGSGSKG